jgi:RHS repeat-associated protein
VHAYQYNKAGAIIEDAVTELADGLNGDVRRIAYSYDNRGLTSQVNSYDVVSGGSVVNEVVMEYDAFMQLSADKQSHEGSVDGSTPQVGYAYETGGTKNSIRRVSTTYPTSSRVVEVEYGAANSMDDHLGRVSALQVTGETDELVNYAYCGRAWQVRVGYPAPGVELKYRQLSGERPGDAGDPYTGYDRFGRTVDMPWVKSSDGSVIERSGYGFDASSRRIWQTRPLTDTQDQQYGYDALSQVSVAARGCLNAQGTAICGIPAAQEAWDYDPTGNWRGYHQLTNGASTLDQGRVHDRGNRLTQIEDNPNNMILDRVGRMRQSAPDAEGDWDGKLEITWDAWSRITGVVSSSGSSGSYRYDGLHRRITREVAGVIWHSYYNDQWRPLEERKDSDTTPATSYLWGARHRDDLVRRDRATSGTSLDETRYVLLDYFNPASITDEDGAVTERYAFSAFGVRTILNADYSVRSSSECAMEFGFQGQFFDEESGLINYGYRYYSPYLGRWTCKDPIQELGGPNLMAAFDNNAIDHVDHLGLKKKVLCNRCTDTGEQACTTCGRKRGKKFLWIFPTKDYRPELKFSTNQSGYGGQGRVPQGTYEINRKGSSWSSGDHYPKEQWAFNTKGSSPAYVQSNGKTWAGVVFHGGWTPGNEPKGVEKGAPDSDGCISIACQADKDALFSWFDELEDEGEEPELEVIDICCNGKKPNEPKCPEES